MLNRHYVLKYVAPLIALGALVLSSRSATGAEFASPVRNSSKRPLAAKKPVSKPAAAPAPAPAPERKAINPEAAWGQVNGENVNVRMGPGTGNAVVTTLRGGDYVKARAIQGQWLEIEWPQSVPAWVGKEFVQKSAESAGAGVVVTATARVLSAGNLKSPVLSNLNKGAKVIIVGEEGTWYKIKAPETAAAYISAKYVLTGVQAPAAPAPAVNSPETKAMQPVPAPEPAKPAMPAAPKAPATKVAAVESVPAQKPVAAPPAEPTLKAELLATVEKSRMQLQASNEPEFSEPLPMNSLATAAKKNEAEEQSRRQTEARRLEEIETSRKATEAKKKAEAEEQARRDAEAKRLEEIETARKATEAKKKAEAEEQARRDVEAKRLEEIETARKATEAKKKAEAEEQARRDAEAKRLEEIETARKATEAKKKAEAEEQTRRDKEAKQQELEIARLAAEAKKKADAEEQARVAAESLKKEADAQRQALEMKQKKNAEEAARAETAAKQQEAEIARLAVEAKKKADAEAAAEAHRATDAKKEELSAPARPQILPEAKDERGGLFVDPAEAMPVPSKPAAQRMILDPKKSVPLPEKQPQHSSAVPDAISVARVEPAPVYVDVSTPDKLEDESAAYSERIPDAIKRVRSKFVVPAGAPRQSGSRAEVIRIIDEEPSAQRLLPVIEETPEAPATSAAPVSVESPRAPAPASPAAAVMPLVPVIDLPNPSGQAPQSFRLKNHFESQIRSADMGGQVTSAYGTIELQPLSNVEGAHYALVRDGRVVHQLTSGANVNLQSYIGRRVTVTGMPVRGSSTVESVLEIGSISSID